MPANLSVNFDGQQYRVKHDRLSALCCGGDDWSVGHRSNAFVELASGTAMLMPNVLDPAWATTGTGHYARYGFADATKTDASWNAEDVSTTAIGDWFLSSKGPVNEIIYWPVQPTNGSLWIAFYPFGTELEGGEYREVGWSNLGEDVSTAVTWLRIYFSGKIQVYRNGVLDGQGSASSVTAAGEQKLPQSFVGFLIIPSRKRELMIISTHGGSFTHVFEDIDEDEPAPVITPNKQFWTYAPNNQQEKVQVAPIYFAGSGWIASKPISFRRPPDTPQNGTVQVRAFGTGGTPTVTSPTDPDTPTAYANTRDCRIRVDMVATSGNRTTPFVYGGIAWFDPILDQTPLGTSEAEDKVTKVSLDVGDELGGTRVTVEATSPDALEADFPLIKTIDNRPVVISLNGEILISGHGAAPDYNISAGGDEAARLTMAVEDAARAAEDYLWSETVPLDGMSLVDAFSMIADTMGCTLDMDDPGVTIPEAGCPGSLKDFNTAIQVGDTSAYWLRELHEIYLGNWHMDITPDRHLRVLDPATMSTDEFITLYPTIQEAIDIGGFSRDEAWKFVYRSVDTKTLAPEANEVIVVGRDSRTGRPIVVTKRDVNAQDPTIAIGSRATNWSGSPRKYGYRNENGIPTLSVAERTCELLYDRMSQPWKLREFECELLRHQAEDLSYTGAIGWKADVVMLYGVGKVRIKTFGGSLDKTSSTDDPWQWQPIRYVGEENLRASSLQTSQRHLSGIERAYRVRIRKRARTVDMLNGLFVGRSPIVSVL